ncbi:recombinase [Actinoplanes sp. N902-109]|nr:recombinase [Actinoplanes sp. N902-109]
MSQAASGLLAEWAAAERKTGPRCFRREPAGLRFAFYGRISTTDHQDHGSSEHWQLCAATELIAGRGRIVSKYFDDGVSRRTSWPDRPEAARLLRDMPAEDRAFDAVVVGEYERAFQGRQLNELAPVLRQCDVALWLPETYGPVDFDSPRQLALLDLLGVRSQQEVAKARYRVIVAMRAQTEVQGRHLGGRPPYGYRLVDAGPHPNRAHAAWGRRLHRLEPDPATAPTVRRIFAERLAGRSVARIARELNDRRLPCPSRVDQARNPHRSGAGWMLTTVAAILANPRYTGRQVWNRQHTEHDDLEALDGLTRQTGIQRWSVGAQWAISARPAHEALVSEADFVAVQQIHTAPAAADGTVRRYALTGLVFCGMCGRALDAHWTHGRAGYRCRHGRNSARSVGQGRPHILYCREDQLIEALQRNSALVRVHPRLRQGSPAGVGDELRRHGMILVGDHDGWIVETDDASIALRAAHLPAALQAEIPA